MNPGVMRHRFTFEAPQDIVDESGGYNRNFLRVTEMWGMMHAIRKPTGYEGLSQEREQQKRLFYVAMRYASVVSAGHRLRLGNRVFDIRSVADPDGMKEQIHLVVEETTP